MSSLFDNLKDDASLLLLFVAGEMSASDRQILERRLATDPALQSLLAEVRADHEKYLRTLAALDAATVPAIPDEAAIQRAGRIVRQWATRRLASPEAAPHGGLRLHRWIYPVATAASLLIGVIVWSVVHNEQQTQTRVISPPSTEHRGGDALAGGTSQPSTASRKKIDYYNEPTQAIAALDDQQQQALLDDFATGGVAGDDSSDSGSDLDEADSAIASLESAGDANNDFLGLDAASAAGRQTQ